MLRAFAPYSAASRPRPSVGRCPVGAPLNGRERFRNTRVATYLPHGIAGCQQAERFQGVTVFFALANEDCFRGALRQIPKAVENQADTLKIPNPAILAVRLSLSESLGFHAD